MYKLVKFNVSIHNTHAWQISRYSHAFYHITIWIKIPHRD